MLRESDSSAEHQIVLPPISDMLVARCIHCEADARWYIDGIPVCRFCMKELQAGRKPPSREQGTPPTNPKQASPLSSSANGFDHSTLWERMTREEYERLYAEALDVVKHKIKGVRDPGITPDGVRLLGVGGMLCDDEMVFSLAWGRQFAQDIVAQRRRASH